MGIFTGFTEIVFPPEIQSYGLDITNFADIVSSILDLFIKITIWELYK